MCTNISFVTGIWNLDRASASDGWGRPFSHYIDNFINLLSEMKDHNLIVFIDETLEDIVWKHRSKLNTRVYYHSKKDFSGNFFPFFDQVQNIRNNPEWYNQAGWLKDSTQGSLEYYNPMVMSKMFLLHNAKIFNPFDSDHLFWIDGGITNTLSLGYFNNPVVIKNIINLSKLFLFIAFPYETNTEIHGFNIDAMKKYAQNDTVNRVARGGFFGGHKDCISEANNLYYSLLNDTLSEGYMGTEESIFTIMTYLDPSTYNFEMINDDGLIYTFFEKLQNVNFAPRLNKKTTIYINTFNSAEQLKLLLNSFEKTDSALLNETNFVLINNTTNMYLLSEYEKIVKQYNIEELRYGNIGICGGRQLAAEHFHNSSSEYMLFFEDDMLLDYKGLCPFGFSKNVPNILDKLIKIMEKEKYDFIKLSFSEFYGHNGQQWSWHNVPQNKRIEYFGDTKQKPSTIFKNIKSLEGIPYADGEIYYSNWPHIINKHGNQKCFIDTKWEHPFEQTWMSHIYDLTKKGIVRPAVLLASPITHDRVYHYGKDERKEN
jgi:hypothetical protein